jgi:hypothetical protein
MMRFAAPEAVLGAWLESNRVVGLYLGQWKVTNRLYIGYQSMLKMGIERCF